MWSHVLYKISYIILFLLLSPDFALFIVGCLFLEFTVAESIDDLSYLSLAYRTHVEGLNLYIISTHSELHLHLKHRGVLLKLYCIPQNKKHFNFRSIKEESIQINQQITHYPRILEKLGL